MCAFYKPSLKDKTLTRAKTMDDSCYGRYSRFGSGGAYYQVAQRLASREGSEWLCWQRQQRALRLQTLLKGATHEGGHSAFSVNAPNPSGRISQLISGRGHSEPGP